MSYARAHDEYLETEVFTAGPVRRIQILYEAALESVTKAKVAQAGGDIAVRAKEVNRATAILTELAVSLDRQQGGALARELVELYDYMIRQLLAGSTAKAVGPFAEAEGLLKTLLDAWKQIPEIETPATESLARLSMGVNDGTAEGDCIDFVDTGVDQFA